MKITTKKKTRKDILVDFVNNELNKDSLYLKAFVEPVRTYENAITQRVEFNMNFREQYNKLLQFCIENDLTII